MLVCRTCGGRVVVDNSESVIVGGNDLWYAIKCIQCSESKGLLANVETTQETYADVIKQEALWKQLHQQKPSSC